MVSARLQLERPTPLKDFTIANLWEAMGVGQGMEPRRHVAQSTVTPEQQEAAQEPQEAHQRPQEAPPEQEPAPEAPEPDRAAQWLDEVARAATVDACKALWHQAGAGGALSDGLKAAINQRVADINAQQQPQQQALEGEIVPGGTA